MPAPHSPHIEVVRVADTTADALAEFFREAWGDTGTGEDVRRSRAHDAATNPIVPGADVPAVAFMRDGKVLGYLGTIPTKFWNGVTETPAHWLKGFMVLPEYRNGPVGFAVLKELLKHVGVSGIMTVAPPARRLFTAVGYVDCGTLANYVSILRPARVATQLDVANLGLGMRPWIDSAAKLAQRVGVAWLAGAAAGVGLGALRALGGAGGAFTIDTSGALPASDALDDLWHRARTTFAAAAVRDGAVLPWRYAPQQNATYEAASVTRRGGKLAAIAVVRRPKGESDPRLRGLKVATLSDWVFPANDPAAGLAALIGAERLAHRMEADALLCSAAHPAMARQLQRRAFVRLPGNVHLMIRDPGRKTALPHEVASWWVTRGDASSDEVF